MNNSLIEEVEFSQEVAKAKLSECDKYVSAIGFERNSMGTILLSDGV